MKREKGAIIGAMFGGAVAAAAYAVVGPFGVLILGAAAQMVESVSKMGEYIAGATEEVLPEFNINVKIG